MNHLYSPTADFMGVECLGENDHLLAWREVERDPATVEKECMIFNILQSERLESRGPIRRPVDRQLARLRWERLDRETSRAQA